MRRLRHFGVLNALQGALAELAVPRHEVVVLAGIGCSGTIQNYVGRYGYHALHGRVLPTAAGVALANPALTVIAAGGDGTARRSGPGTWSTRSAAISVSPTSS